MTTRAASALRLAGLAAATLTVSACGVFSPVQTDYPYIPADGVPLTIPGLDLRNLVIVSDEEGGPGTIVGQAVNEGRDPVEVSFSLEGSSPTTTTVAPYSDDAISADGKAVTLETVPQRPGSMVQLVVTTQQAGQNVVQVPVLPSERYYEGLAPSPSATPSASPSPSAS